MSLQLGLLSPLIYPMLANGLTSNQQQRSTNDPVLQQQPILLIPSANMIDNTGNLKDNVSLIKTTDPQAKGTIADGVSKLIIVANYDKPVEFSLKNSDNGTTNLTAAGTLSSLTKVVGIGKNIKSSSMLDATSASKTTVIVQPQTKDNKSVIAAVYTPPSYINLTGHRNNTKITVQINSTTNTSIPYNKQVSIKLYRVPVVLVHGIWVNSTISWKSTNFINPMVTDGFNYTFADYGKYNATTFDPYANKTLGKYNVEAGNYGIEAIRDKIYGVLKDYHHKSIAASQVDIIAHSMGGLMARGFTQQSDYYNKSNYMKGYIHRLITIGTPHFGAPLSEFLFFHRNDQYCFNPYTNKIVQSTFCLFDPLHFQLFPLKTIYAEKLIPKLHSSIDKGGVEALSPRSVAYSDLCQTNVSSYAIAGSWKSNGVFSRDAIEDLYKIILGNPFFNLERDGFHGDNDLQVNMTSQLGGIHGQIRQQLTTANYTLPIGGAIYNNTIHGSIFKDKHDLFVSSELISPVIQHDVVKLLNSPDNIFVHSIGKGSPCHKPGKL